MMSSKFNDTYRVPDRCDVAGKPGWSVTDAERPAWWDADVIGSWDKLDPGNRPSHRADKGSPARDDRPRYDLTFYYASIATIVVLLIWRIAHG